MLVMRVGIVIALASVWVASQNVHAQVSGIHGASDWLEGLRDCSNEGGTIHIAGHFVSTDQKTTVRAWGEAGNQSCHVQHEDGPIVRLDSSDWRELADWQICHDGETGLDKLMVSKNTFSNGAPIWLEVWDVTGGRVTPVGYERKYWGESFGGIFPADMVSTDGVCSPRVSRKAVGIVTAAQEALFDGAERYLYIRSGTAGETMRLDYKTLPDEVVQRNLLLLASAPEHDAHVYRVANIGGDGRWSVVIVRLTPECGHKAVVLARDVGNGVWKSLVRIPGVTPGYTNCAITNGGMPEFYFPHAISVDGDVLTMVFTTRDDESEFGLVVDLRTGEANYLGHGVAAPAPKSISGAELSALFCRNGSDVCGEVR